MAQERFVKSTTPDRSGQKEHLKKFLWLTLSYFSSLLANLIYLSLNLWRIVYSENGGMIRNMIVKSYTQTIPVAPWKEKMKDFRLFLFW